MMLGRIVAFVTCVKKNEKYLLRHGQDFGFVCMFDLYFPV